jgi:hypothetical protein
MNLSKYSNLEHLREVAMNLCLSENHDDINELSEKKLAALIHTFYQVCHLFIYISTYIKIFTMYIEKILQFTNLISNTTALLLTH